MNDSFYVGAYWGNRKETLSEVAAKTANTLKDLGELDSHFTSWYELGISRKKALEKRVLLESKNINMLFQKRIKKEEIDSLGYTSHFFSLGLWTGQKDEEASSINFTTGGVFNTDKISNCCVIKIPYEGNARERLLKLEKGKSLIGILIKNWNPDYALLTSHDLSRKLNGINRIGWITYSKNFKSIPRFNDKIVIEKQNEGHLFYLSLTNDDCYDYNLINQLLLFKEIIK